MVNIAIAGGTSPTLGKSITEAILATGKHNVIVLTRASDSDQNPDPSTSAPKSQLTDHKYAAPLIPTDYTSPTTLTQILTHHKIHTLISLLKPTSPDPNASLNLHTTLLSACQSARVSRFILSDWSLAPPSHNHVDLLAHKADLHTLGQQYMSRASEAGEIVVECSTIQVGGFMEYFAQGCDDGDPTGVLLNGLIDGLMLEYIDIPSGKIVIPCREDGKPARVSMTSLRDVGRCVAAALDLPRGQMSGQVGIVGDVFTFEEVVEVLKGLERTKGVEGVYTNRKECEERAERCGRELERKLREKGDFDVGLLKGRMVSQMMGCLCGEEEGGGVVSGILLNELCPGVETLKVEELLRRAWGGGGTK